MINFNKEYLSDYNFGKAYLCPCCREKISIFRKTEAEGVERYMYHLKGNSSCALCRNIDVFSSFYKEELVAFWNLVINCIHTVDGLRIQQRYPPDVRYRTVIDLIPLLDDEDRALVNRFMNEYYPSPAKTNCSVDELLRGEANE